jgi:hypothetical protein
MVFWVIHINALFHDAYAFSVTLFFATQWHNHGPALMRIVCKQALLKLCECREGRLRRVALQVNQDDVVFALQVVIAGGKQHFQNSVLYFSCLRLKIALVLTFCLVGI